MTKSIKLTVFRIMRITGLEPARDSPLEPKGFIHKNIQFYSILFKLVQSTELPYFFKHYIQLSA